MKNNFKNMSFKKKALPAMIANVLWFLAQSAHAASFTLSPTPLFLTSNVKPDIMVLYGNSNSMDEDPTGAAVGSANPSSKSEIARAAVKNLVSTYSGKVNMGLMGYKQTGTAANDLYNSPYDANFDPTTYNPSYTGARESSTQKKFRLTNPTDTGKYIYYNVALPSYLPSNYHSTSSTFFCFTTDTRSKAFNNGEVIVGNDVYNASSGPWLNYGCYKTKTGSGNAGPTNTNATANGYGTALGGLSGKFYPTDSDLAQGITNYGNQLAGIYVSPTWFSNTAVNTGYVHTPIALLDSTQSGKLNTKLGTSQFTSNQPTNAAYPLQNAGLSPIASSVLTAQRYFSGTLTSSSEGGPLAAPPNACGKNFLVMLTDGLPSTLANGTESYDTTALLNDLTTTVAGANTGTSTGFTTYVVGFALPYGVLPSQLNSIAVAGGTTSPYYADDSATLNTALNNVFSNIIAKTGAASSVALNSGYISSGDKLYQARFNSNDWSGELLSIPLGSDGSTPSDLVNSATWKASVTTGSKSPSARTILTMKASSGVGIPFEWPVNPASPTSTEMDTAQSTYLSTNPNTSLGDALGASRLNFLRGDRSLEGSTFRTRSSVLGDIVNSSPILVKTPAGTMTSASYITFKQSQASRPSMIYVGANDGMVHGYKADTGEELLAYIPNAVLSGVNQLTSTSYTHRYFVDGNPNAGDVYYGGAWHTVLVGSMGNGGRGIYSLDVTNPTTFSESNASSIVKFEYTNNNDADVGYISGAPSIVQLNDGKMAAIFGNGYNGTGTGQSALYIVDIQTGTLIKKITTGVGNLTTPNALSNPTSIDVDGNGTIDYVYAGDTYGNVWKFDLTDSNTANWKVAYSGTPLFTASQPITTEPEVTINPTGGYMVLVGTGKYLEVGDNSTTSTNYFFGLWDNGVSAISSMSQLQAQTVTSATSTSRQISSNAVNYGTQRGWYLTLPTSGERSVTDPVVKGGKVIFTTLIPSSALCSYGGTSWLMELNYLNGNQPSTPTFDTNGDNIINSSDTASGGVAIAGIASAPTILQGLGSLTNPVQRVFTNESTGAVANILNTGSSLTSRRTAWKEVINR